LQNASEINVGSATTVPEHWHGYGQQFRHYVPLVASKYRHLVPAVVLVIGNLRSAGSDWNGPNGWQPAERASKGPLAGNRAPVEIARQ